MPQAATASDLDFSSQGELVPELLDFSDQGELVSPTVQPTAPPQPEATIGPDTSFRARHPTLSKLRDNPLTDFLIGPDPAGPDMTQLQAESGRGGGVFSPDPNIHPIPIITAPPETGKIGQVAAAIKNIPANLVNSIAGNPLPFAIPGGKLLSLVFGLQMASEVPSEYRNAKKVVDDPKATLQEKIEAVAAVPATATMAGLSLAHAASGLRSTRPSPPSDTGAAEQSAKLEELASKSRGIDQAREQAAAAARQAPGPQIAQPGLPLQATAPPEFQPSAPAIPIKRPPAQKIPATTLRQQEADAQRAQKMATEPSGLSMAVDKAKQAQWGDIPANDQMLAMLPQDRPSLQPPVGPTSPESVPQGGAPQAVRQAGEAVQRAQDYPKAAAEKVSQEQVPPVHPDKPLTGNQLTIIQDSLRKAITDNQIPGERKGFIAGSGLEKWADGVLHDHSWLKQANADLGLKLTTESAKRVAALAVKGTALIERGVTDFARWSAEMVKEHGEDIKPWLKKVYQQSVSIRAGAFSQPETQEVQNARSQQETAAVHGNVQPQQPPGSGLPAQERGGGIQSQAAGGLQEGGEAPPSGAPPVSVRGGALNPDEVRAKYPDAFKGSTARDIPVEIKLSDGTVVPGVMNGYQGTPDGPRPSVAKLKNDGQPGSHGMLGPGEEIVSQPPTQEQLDAGKAAQRRVDEIQRVSAEPATSFTGKDRSGLAAIEFGKKATTPHEVEALRKAEAAAKAEVDQAKGVARLIPKKKQQFFTEALREAEKQTTVTKTAKEPGKLHSSDLPDWAREEMKSRGLNPNRTFNDQDLQNPSIVEAIKSDPTLTDEQKNNLLKNGSLKQSNQPFSLDLGDGFRASIDPQTEQIHYYNTKTGERIGGLQTSEGPNGEIVVENHYVDEDARGKGRGEQALRKLAELTGKRIISDQYPSEAARSMWQRMGATREKIDFGNDEIQTRYVFDPKRSAAQPVGMGGAALGEVEGIPTIEDTISGKLAPPREKAMPQVSPQSAPVIDSMASAMKSAVENVRGFIGGLAGKTLPRITIKSQKLGELGTRWLSSRIAARPVAEVFGADVLGDSGIDPRTLGAALSEDNLRSIKKAFEDKGETDRASGVHSLIGREDSPFQSEDQYQAFLNDPKVKEVIARHIDLWRSVVEPKYKEAMSIDPEVELPSRGLQTGARINLRAILEDDATHDVVRTTARGNLTGTFKRKSPFGVQAKGTGEGYHVNYYDVMENTFGKQLEIANKNAFDKALVEQGQAVIAPPGQRVLIEGKPATAFPYKRGPFGNQNLYVNAKLSNEYRIAANVDMKPPSIILQKITSALNTAAISSGTDATTHMANLGSALMTLPGTSGKLLHDTILSALPGRPDAPVAIIRALVKGFQDNRAQLAALAEIGALKEPHEATRVPVLRQASQAIQWLDKTTRLALDDTYKRLAQSGIVENSETARREFVNQVGQYNKRAQGYYTRFFRDTGLGPFITAGKTFNTLGVRAATLNPGVRATSIPAAMAMKANMAAKIAGTIGTIATLSYLLTKDKPNGGAMGRPGVPLGAIDLGTDDKNGRPEYIALFNMTSAGRGLRLLGVLGVVQAKLQGLPNEVALDSGARDIINSAIAPWAGPTVRFGVEAATGYPTAVNVGRATPVVPPGHSQRIADFKEAVIQSSPLAAGIEKANQPGGAGITDVLKSQLPRFLPQSGKPPEMMNDYPAIVRRAQANAFIDDVIGRARKIEPAERSKFLQESVDRLDNADDKAKAWREFKYRKVMK